MTDEDENYDRDACCHAEPLVESDPGLQWRVANIDVSISDMTDNNFEEFLDVICQRAFGTADVQGIDYMICSVRGREWVELQVTGMVNTDSIVAVNESEETA